MCAIVVDFDRYGLFSNNDKLSKQLHDIQKKRIIKSLEKILLFA